MNKKFSFKLKPTAVAMSISLSMMSSIAAGAIVEMNNDGATYYQTIWNNSAGSTPKHGDNITIITTGPGEGAGIGNASGVYSNLAGDIMVGDYLTIKTSGADADGLRSNPSGLSNWANATGTITIGDNLVLTTTGLSADAANINGYSVLYLGNNAVLRTEYAGALGAKEGAHGLRANHGSKIFVGDRLNVTTLGDRSHGIYMTGSYSPVVQIGSNSIIQTEGTSSNAAQVGGTSSTLSAGNYAQWGTKGNTSHAIQITSANSISTLGKNASLTTEGIGSHAVYINARNGVLNLGESALLHTQGEKSYGIYSYGYKSGASTIYDSKVDVGQKAKILTEGNLSHGVYMYSAGAEITLGENSSVETQGDDAHALYGHGSKSSPTSTIIYGENGKITAKDNITLKTTGAGAHGAYVDWATSSIDFQGATTISATGANSYALYANAGTISSSTAAKYNVTGDMQVDDAGTIDLQMTNGSSFNGNTFVTGTNGKLNLDIAGASSVWQMTEDSQLTNLNLSSDAQVRVGDQTTAINAANQVTLTTENLSGNGHFYVRTSIIDSDDTGPGINISDKIKVTGTSSGNHKIFVKDNNTGGAVGTEIVRVAEIADGVAQFALSNVNGYVDMGAYRYSLNEVDPLITPGEKHWYLVAGAKTGGGKEKTPTADSSANILNINYLLNYVETQTLLQRMGELRQSEGSNGDVWARAYTGKLDSFSDGILEGFDIDYTGVQIGADKRFAQDNGDFYLGGMVGTAEAKASYKVGDGKTTSYHAGVYATYKHTNGFYVDGIAKFVHMENTLNTETGGGYAVKGDGNTSGYSIGVEAGKRFYFKEANAGWYAEPQAQLTFAHQDGATIQANNGLRTDLDSFDSTLGRISAIIGYSIVDGANPVDVYFKTGYVKEFDGDTGYTYNNAIHESYKLNGNWWDNGIGINAKINKQHNLYLDATYSSGSKFDQMQINAGYRYAF